MADKEANIIVRIKDLASVQLRNFKNSLKDLEGQTLTLAAAFTSFILFLRSSLNDWINQENAVLKLDNALSLLPGTTEGASQRLQDLADNLQKVTAFSDENIISSQALLASFKLTEDQIAALTPRVLDLAARMGVDAQTAALQLGKAIATGSTDQLRRMGVIIDETAIKSGDLTTFLKQLDGVSGGLAIKMGNTTFGAIQKLKNSFSNMNEEIGKSLSRALIPLMNGISLFLPIITNFIIQHRGAVIAVTGLAAAGLILTTTILGLFKVVALLTTAFTILTSPIILATGAVIGLGIVITGLATNFLGLWDVAKIVFDGILSALNNLGNALIEFSQGKFREALNSIKEAHDEFIQGVTDGATLLADNMKIKWDEVQDAIVEKQKMATDAISQQLKKQLSDLEFNNLAMLQENQKNQKNVEAQFAKHLNIQKKGRLEFKTWEEMTEQERLSFTSNMLNRISSLQSSKMREMVALGRAAAVTQVIIDTAVAAMAARRALSSILVVGPYLAAAAMAATIAAGAVQIAAIRGAPNFAEGGIVLPTHGGTLARIGEAGSAEAVIPLDDERAGSMIGGPTININVGTLVADEISVREFARRIDEELFALNRNRQSVAF